MAEGKSAAELKKIRERWRTTEGKVGEIMDTAVGEILKSTVTVAEKIVATARKPRKPRRTSAERIADAAAKVRSQSGPGRPARSAKPKRVMGEKRLTHETEAERLASVLKRRRARQR